MSVMRICYVKRGGHYHCRVYTARVPNQTYTQNGNLVFDEEEFADVQRIMSGAEFLLEWDEPAEKETSD